MTKIYSYIVQVKEVLSPTSFLATVDVGMGLTFDNQKFVLSNVLCPSKDHDEDGYYRAKDYLAEWIEGKEVKIKSDLYDLGEGFPCIVILKNYEESLNHLMANALSQEYYEKA